MSCPVLARGLTIESVYRSGPGRLEPHGNFAEPVKGAGFDTPMYRLRRVSNVGGFHMSTLELMVVCAENQRFVGTSSNFHLVAPVEASIAHKTAWPLPA